MGRPDTIAACALDQGAFAPDKHDDSVHPGVINGQPARYYWKDLAHVGRYENAGKEMVMSHTDILALAKKINAMRAEGIPIPLVLGVNHGEKGKDPRDVKPWETQGYIICAKPSETAVMGRAPGDDIMAYVQVIGDDAQRNVSRNFVSIVRDFKTTDGQGRSWGDAIVNVALTPNPVIENQGPFLQAASKESDSEESIPLLFAAAKQENLMDNWPCSKEHESALNDHVPGLASVHVNSKIPHIVSHMDGQKAALSRLHHGISAMCHTMSKSFDPAKPDEHLGAINDKLKQPTPESPKPAAMSKEMAVEHTGLFHERIDMAFQKNEITAEQQRLMKGWTPTDSPNVFAMSKQDGADKRMADFVLEIAKAGGKGRQPDPKQPRSVVQSLSREVPDPDGVNANPQQWSKAPENPDDNPLIALSKKWMPVQAK